MMHSCRFGSGILWKRMMTCINVPGLLAFMCSSSTLQGFIVVVSIDNDALG